MTDPADSEKTTVTPGQLSERLGDEPPLVLLDVRTLEEFNGQLGHLKNAILIPVQELERRLVELQPFRDKTIVAYCRSGNRSHHAMVVLRRHGYNAINLVGGMIRWNEERLPVIKT